MTTPTDAQLTAIAGNIFVMGDRTKTKLPVPTAHGPTAFKDALDNAVGKAHDFQDAGIVVVDFTKSASSPDIWLHNEAKAFRIGSASKIAMMLAAVQLRLDVRQILKMSPKIVSTPAEFDALYANPKLWAKSKAPLTEEMSRIASVPPLISKIFDFSKSQVDFAGPDPDGRIDAHGQPDVATQNAIVAKLPPAVPPGGLRELAWDHWSDLSFSERLWLAGNRSDNVAATSCVCEIGLPYIKAVQRAYGLVDDDPKKGMHLFATRGYGSDPPASAKPPAVAPPRPLSKHDVKKLEVADFGLVFDAGRGRFTDNRSWVPGSAAALAAYMIALKNDSLVDDGSVGLFGQRGCTTLRNNLADGGPNAIESFFAGEDRIDHGVHVVTGVLAVPGTRINRQINKIGILRKSDHVKAPLICEFVYLETQQVPKPAAPHREFMQYAVAAVGLISELDAKPPGHSASGKAGRLGAAVHQALLDL
jgi:hypothetical protein